MASPSLRKASAPLFQPVGFSPTAQQCAIQTSTARYVIAMANAGAAKTTTLALRIAESIRRGVFPESIIALTFSREAARVLKRRLAEIGLEDELARRVICSTFEDFCRYVLREHEGQDTPYLATFEDVTPHVRAAAAELQRIDAQQRTPRDLWLPDHNARIADFLTLARRMKADLVSAELDEDETVATRAEMLNIPEGIYRLYRQLEKVRANDDGGKWWRTVLDPTFDLASLLEQDEPVPRLARYRLVVVDELQDMNPAALCCLEHLIRQSGSWFLGAGDFDQVIHRWAGADAMLIRSRLGAAWPNVQRLPLTTTFRHGPAMAQATSHLKNKAVVSGRRHGAVLRIERYNDAADEAIKLVERVCDWKQRGNRLDACAIIVRAPHQSISIENALLKANIGWQLQGLKSYFRRAEVLMLRGVIAYALGDYQSIPGAEMRLEVLHALTFWQELGWDEKRQHDLRTAADQPEMFKEFFEGQLLRPQTRYDKAVAGLSEEQENQAEQRLLDLIRKLRREGRGNEAEILVQRRREDAETVNESESQQRARARLKVALETLRAAQTDEPAHLALQRACHALDLGSVARRLYIDPNEANMVTRSVQGFVDAARHLDQPLHAFAQWLRRAESAAVKLRKGNQVLLCTVEAAKGREFDAVMLPGVEDRTFPMAGWDSTEESNRFYVAVTRMRDELTLFVPQETALVSPFVAALRINEAISRGRSQLDALLTGNVWGANEA